MIVLFFSALFVPATNESNGKTWAAVTRRWMVNLNYANQNPIFWEQILLYWIYI